MDRRQFILGSASLFAAPAIVKAENIMKVFVPKNYLNLDVDFDLNEEYNISFWFKGPNAKPGDVMKYYTKNLNYSEKLNRRIELTNIEKESFVGGLNINGCMTRIRN